MRDEGIWIATENELRGAEGGLPAGETNCMRDHPTQRKPCDVRPASFPICEREGHDAIRTGIRAAEITGLSGSALPAALMSETLPRLVNAHGPANAALILTRIAHDIRTGAAPNTTRQ